MFNIKLIVGVLIGILLTDLYYKKKYGSVVTKGNDIDAVKSRIKANIEGFLNDSDLKKEYDSKKVANDLVEEQIVDTKI